MTWTSARPPPREAAGTRWRFEKEDPPPPSSSPPGSNFSFSKFCLEIYTTTLRLRFSSSFLSDARVFRHTYTTPTTTPSLVYLPFLGCSQEKAEKQIFNREFVDREEERNLTKIHSFLKNKILRLWRAASCIPPPPLCTSGEFERERERKRQRARLLREVKTQSVSSVRPPL